MNCPHCGTQIEISVKALTPREIELARYLVESDKKFADLAKELGMHVNSLLNAAHFIYKKLGVNKRKELVALAKDGEFLNESAA